MCLSLLTHIVFTLLFHPDAAEFHPKIDANGNCEAGEKVSLPMLSFLVTFEKSGSQAETNVPLCVFLQQIHHGYVGETQLTSFTKSSPEQQCLLEQGEVSSEQSQSSTRTDGCSSEESIGPLQSTLCVSPLSALSEPMSLLSNTELETTQTSISTPAAQPTVTTSPQVNVNITFNIGNSSAGTQPVIPADLVQADPELPFGEEESFSIPQQEDGKQSLLSVQESESWNTMHMEDYFFSLCCSKQHKKQSEWLQDALIGYSLFQWGQYDRFKLVSVSISLSTTSMC